MKKAGLIVCAFAMLATLTGCKDAVADISNGSEKLVSVGDTTITKDKLYNLLKGSNGGSATIELVQNKIYEKEGIKLSEDMKKEAKKTLASTKKTFGGEEAFLNAIKSYGFNSEEEYLEKASYPCLLYTSSRPFASEHIHTIKSMMNTANRVNTYSNWYKLYN